MKDCLISARYRRSVMFYSLQCFCCYITQTLSLLPVGVSRPALTLDLIRLLKSLNTSHFAAFSHLHKGLRHTHTHTHTQMLSAEGGCGCFHGSVCLSSVWSTVRSLADYRVDPLIVLIQFLLTDEWMEQRQQSSRASCCPLTFGLLLWSVVALRLSLKFIACCAVAPELI